MTSEVKKLIARDCLWAMVLILAATTFLTVMFIHCGRANGITEKKIAEIEQEIIKIKQLIPVASADRWSRTMMKIYDEKLMAYISDPTSPKPDIERIRLTTPVISNP